MSKSENRDTNGPVEAKNEMPSQYELTIKIIDNMIDR